MTTTKRELWLKATSKRSRGTLEDFFTTKGWKDLFSKVLRAPWRPEAKDKDSNDPVDALRARVEHHLLNGKGTAADALLTALQEDPQLYERALTATTETRKATSTRETK